ncbi:acylphosphatase [Candidatus Riflebacteria bacterium]
MQQRIFVKFYGRVQGVGFRWTTMRVAHSFDVTGRIENMPDGTVEMVAEGNKKTIDDFIQTCMKTFQFPINCTHFEIIREEEAPAKHKNFTLGIPM